MEKPGKARTQSDSLRRLKTCITRNNASQFVPVQQSPVHSELHLSYYWCAFCSKLSAIAFARVQRFTARLTHRGGSVRPPALRPPMKLNLLSKNERVALGERKPIISNIRVLVLKKKLPETFHDQKWVRGYTKGSLVVIFRFNVWSLPVTRCLNLKSV